MVPKPRILVVDDDRGVAETMAALLRLHDYEVRAAFSGRAAIRMALEFEPEVLITDVVMPGMNGLEIASHIRSLFPRCKVLLISGRSVAADLVLKTHVLTEVSSCSPSRCIRMICWNGSKTGHSLSVL